MSTIETDTPPTSEENGPSQPGALIATLTGFALVPLAIVLNATVPKNFFSQHSTVFALVFFGILGLGFMTGIAVDIALRAGYRRERPTLDLPELQEPLGERDGYQIYGMPFFVLALIGGPILGVYIPENVPASQQPLWLGLTFAGAFGLIGLGLAAMGFARYISRGRQAHTLSTLGVLRRIGLLLLVTGLFAAAPVVLGSLRFLPDFGKYTGLIYAGAGLAFCVVFFFAALANDAVRQRGKRVRTEQPTEIDKPVMS